MRLTLKTDDGRFARPSTIPHRENPMPVQAVTLLLNDKAEKVIRRHFATQPAENPEPFRLYLTVLSGIEGHVPYVSVNVVGMDLAPGWLTPLTEHQALTHTAKAKPGTGIDLPMQSAWYGQHSVWQLTEEQFEGWRGPRAIEVCYLGQPFPAMIAIKTPAEVQLIERTLVKYEEEVEKEAKSRGARVPPPVINWAGGLIYGSRLANDYHPVLLDDLLDEAMGNLADQAEKALAEMREAKEGKP